MSAADTALNAVLSALAPHLPSGAEAQRNGVLPEKIPAAGLIILADGDPGAPEVTIGVRTWTYEHTAEAEIYVTGKDESTRVSRLALLTAALDAAFADPTLGGAVTWAECTAGPTGDIPVDGGAPIKSQRVPVTLVYTTTTPLA